MAHAQYCGLAFITISFFSRSVESVSVLLPIAIFSGRYSEQQVLVGRS